MESRRTALVAMAHPDDPLVIDTEPSRRSNALHRRSHKHPHIDIASPTQSCITERHRPPDRSCTRAVFIVTV
jgi:hypothetical protein